MTISYSIDHEKNIVYETAKDEVFLLDFIDLRKKLLNEKLQMNFKVLADYRDAKVNLSFEEMLIVKENTFQVIKKYKTAMLAIVATGDLGRGMANMYRQVYEDSNFKVATFTDYDEACHWLQQ